MTTASDAKDFNYDGAINDKNDDIKMSKLMNEGVKGRVPDQAQKLKQFDSAQIEKYSKATSASKQMSRNFVNEMKQQMPPMNSLETVDSNESLPIKGEVCLSVEEDHKPSSNDQDEDDG